MLLNPFGPVHDHVIAPVLVVEAVKFNVDPLHRGPLLEAVGVAGGLGSVKLKGPTAFELQPLLVTVMFEYDPAVKFPMMIFPGAIAVMLTLTNPAGPVY